MIIAVDDSGDPGFKIGMGSSEYFAIAAVFFEDDLDAEETALKVKRLRKELGWNSLHEFKFRKTSDEIKRRFFKQLRGLNFYTVVKVVKKSEFYDTRLRKNPSLFYNTVILETLASARSELTGAHIYIDGEGGNDYRRRAKTFFRQHLPKQAIRALTYRDSREDNLIQVADMLAGAAIYDCTHDAKPSYLSVLKRQVVVEQFTR